MSRSDSYYFEGVVGFVPRVGFGISICMFLKDKAVIATV
jgi:hypothetical protein